MAGGTTELNNALQNLLKAVSPLGGATTAEEALANLGGISMELLWENASPTSAFPAQSFNLDLSKYEYILVVATYRTDIQTRFKYEYCKVGYFSEFSLLSSNWSTSFSTRFFEAGTNAIRFLEANTYPIDAGGYSTTNNYLIPLYIYGIKNIKGAA